MLSGLARSFRRTGSLTFGNPPGVARRTLGCLLCPKYERA